MGNALIDGYLEGIVKAEGSDFKLTIGERGHVKGSVVVPNLLVNGTIEGKVRVAERLKLGPKGRIIGNVQYNLLEISIGAQVDGKFVHKSEGALSKKSKKARAELSSRAEIAHSSLGYRSSTLLDLNCSCSRQDTLTHHFGG